ncbi:hypothetical protein ACFWVP_19350 [Streptomyces sp. NPDC058637]|uniref:hypothetical protein n=1 Tax=Streptomyces sp. NPDC058637 TaxID=3346569 RepID=UPI003656458A
MLTPDPPVIPASLPGELLDQATVDYLRTGASGGCSFPAPPTALSARFACPCTMSAPTDRSPRARASPAPPAHHAERAALRAGEGASVTPG